MGTVRIILLIIHIISAGLWISEEGIGLILRRLINTNKGKPNELTLASATMTVMGTLGPVASMGIMLTGIGLTLNNGWVLFGIGGFTPGWLFVKQLVYIALIVFVMVVLKPRSEHLQKSFANATASGVLSDEGRVLLGQFWVIGTIHTLIVLVNIILAVWKPSIG